MPKHLILRLEAPLMAFGSTMIDANGPTHDLPIVSMVTGLIANALGWQRAQLEQHRNLQQRIVMGARLDRPGTDLRDFQTAVLFEDEKGWTTFGSPEGREKSPSYSWGSSGRKELNYIRNRHYRADAFVTIALRLEPADESPTLDEVAVALVEPARPLFIGRKPCLPSRPLLSEPSLDAANVYEALTCAAMVETSGSNARVRLVLPRRDWPPSPVPLKTELVADVRDWIAGVHAGETRHGFFSIDRSMLPTLDGERQP
jgi:CRISPR system Cascade subunit CasD